MDEFAQQLSDAIKAHRQLPTFTVDLTLQEAYDLQGLVAKKVSPAGLAGLKAGVTSNQLQQLFDIDHALMGRLYRSGQLSGEVVLPYLGKRSIECEIAIIIDARGLPKSAGPALEFVVLDFASREDMTGPNLVAGNLAADQFLAGEQLPWRESFEDIVVRLYRDDELVNEASMMESLGGPHAALDWMLSEADQRNIRISDGMLFMTGTCGQVIPALPGKYRADYGALGTITFSVA